jgi:hypothetical protein
MYDMVGRYSRCFLAVVDHCSVAIRGHTQLQIKIYQHDKSCVVWGGVQHNRSDYAQIFGVLNPPSLPTGIRQRQTGAEFSVLEAGHETTNIGDDVICLENATWRGWPIGLG